MHRLTVHRLLPHTNFQNLEANAFYNKILGMVGILVLIYQKCNGICPDILPAPLGIWLEARWYVTTSHQNPIAPGFVAGFNILTIYLTQQLHISHFISFHQFRVVKIGILL